MESLTLNKVKNIIHLPIQWPFESDSMKRIFHVVYSIENAENYQSKIDPNTYEGYALLNYKGMTGSKTRHFYNNLCSLPNTCYLEIGTYYGSSSISALYQNDNVNAVFIDNWSEFKADSSILLSALEKYASKKSSYKLIEDDCWKVDTSQLGKFNIYLYDGEHSIESHFNALLYYYNNLDDEFIFIVDDYNWEGVRTATEDSFKHLNLQVLFRHQILVPEEHVRNMPHSNYSKKTWWNGIGIFVLRKSTPINKNEYTIV